MDGQNYLYKLQNMLGSGKKFLSAAEDPLAASQVLLNSQSLSVNTQHAENQANASAQLALEEDRLQSVVDSVQYIKEQIVAAGNTTHTDEQREYFAQTLQSQLDFLMGIANSTDANGYYLFSGYKGHTQPFQRQSDGTIQYLGDDGQRLMQVGTSRQIPISDSGRDIFSGLTGNGSFALGVGGNILTTPPSDDNLGTGVIGGGSVNDIATSMFAQHSTELPQDSRIIQFFENVVPYSKTNPEDVNDIRNWGLHRAVPANAADEKRPAATGERARQVVLL
jgi:flagellar hook-associated protein 3 FlgL